jgi:hypothetical protein
LPEQRFNQTELNQYGKEKLLEAKAERSQGSPYILQLAMWGLDNGLEVKEHLPLRDHLEFLLYQAIPEKAMKFLEGEHDLMTELEPDMEPLEAAEVVIEHLHSRLQAEIEGYNIPMPYRGWP